jgi:hypothetical protein
LFYLLPDGIAVKPTPIDAIIPVATPIEKVVPTLVATADPVNAIIAKLFVNSK